MLVNIRVVDTLEGFAMLRQEWTRLLPDAEPVSIFNTWEWLYHWWKQYGKQHPLRLVVASDGNAVLGILPVYVHVRRVWGRIPVRLLRYVGTGGDTSPDYLGPIVRRERADEVADRLAVFVLEELPEWDVLHLTDMPQGSKFQQAISRRCGASGRAFREGVSARISYLRLSPSWDEYLGSLHRDRRYAVRHNRRKFESLPGSRFFVWSDGTTIDEAVDRLIELHHSRWHDRADSHAFSSPEYVGFHRALIHSLLDRGWLRLYCLAVEDRVIAMYYCYRFDGTVSYFQGGFDPAHEHLRPGMCLMGYAIDHAISEGNREFDMLRGEYDYKRQWAKDTRETSFVTGYRDNAAALLFRAASEYLPGLKSAVKRTIARGSAAAKEGIFRGRWA